LKYLSSIFDTVGGWRDTGCNGVMIGRPVRAAQHGTDDFWTVDVAISFAAVEGHPVPPGRYLRLELAPGMPANDSIAGHTPDSNDVIRVDGPLVWDKDKDPPHFPDGHMELHPAGAVAFGAAPPNEHASTPATQTPATPEQQAAVLAGQPNGSAETGPIGLYTVQPSDSLARIARRLYGRDHWQPVYCGNRPKVHLPDLIYPGQQFVLPVSPDELAAARCDAPRSKWRLRHERRHHARRATAAAT
jgi:hypothetical protein